MTDDHTLAVRAVEVAASQILRQVVPEGAPQDGLRETPARVGRMWMEELTIGYRVDVPGLFRLFDAEDFAGMIVVKDIPVRSLCEHHLVPIVGYAHLGYFPRGRVIGLSKLARLVEAYARRLQVQERLTRQVHEAMSTHLEQDGVAVMVEAEHMCMTLRGVQAPGTKTVTATMTGRFQETQVKDEFLTAIQRNGH